ncbi:hypothetical protein GCM10023107_16110 [Actinoplanes octamycinicus]
MVKRTARALGYLVTGPVAGIAGLLWSVVAGVLVTLLAVTQLGGPAFLSAAWLTRHLAAAERWRAGWVLGAPIPAPTCQWRAARCGTGSARSPASRPRGVTWPG